MDMTLTPEEIKIIKQLLEQASVPVKQARAVADLYEKVKAATENG